MNNPTKVYYESKKRALAYGLIVFIPLILMILSEFYYESSNSVYIATLIKLVVIFGVIFYIFIIHYPTSYLEINNEGFIYKKGKLDIQSKWSEVNTIAFQNVPEPISPISAFVISSVQGKTKLIETKVLKLKDNENKKIILLDFVSELQAMSGKEIKWGEVSTGVYSNIGFLNLLLSEKKWYYYKYE